MKKTRSKKSRDTVPLNNVLQFGTRFSTLQITNIENSKQIFSENELRDHIPNVHIHLSILSDLYFTTVGPRFCCRKYVDRSWEYKIAHRHMNVEIGTEAAQFPGKEYVNEIFIAV